MNNVQCHFERLLVSLSLISRHLIGQAKKKSHFIGSREESRAKNGRGRMLLYTNFRENDAFSFFSNGRPLKAGSWDDAFWMARKDDDDDFFLLLPLLWIVISRRKEEVKPNFKQTNFETVKQKKVKLVVAFDHDILTWKAFWNCFKETFWALYCSNSHRMCVVWTYSTNKKRDT